MTTIIANGKTLFEREGCGEEYQQKNGYSLLVHKVNGHSPSSEFPLDVIFIFILSHRY